MSGKPPFSPRSTLKQARDMVNWTVGFFGFLTLVGWLYKVPGINPAVSWLTTSLSPWTAPFLYKVLRMSNPVGLTVFTLVILVFVLLFAAAPLIPSIERRLIRDSIRKGERQAIKVQKIRDSMEVKLRPKNNDNAR